MPRIPEYNEQYRYAGRAGNLGGRLNPGDYGGTAGAIGASGRIAGQQWQQAGAALTKAADTAALIYDDYNTTKAQQAVSGLQKNFLAWQSEMAKNKGEAGMDAGAQYEQWQKKQVAELTKGMSEVQRGCFNALAEVKAAGFRQWAADYGSEQGLVFRNAEDVAGIKASGEVLVANLTNPSIAEPAIDSIRKNAESIANRKGLGEAARARFVKDALSESITPAIDAQIDAGKLSTARTALLHYKDKIGAANALKLQAAIRREGRRLEAEARAEQERAQNRLAAENARELLTRFGGDSQQAIEHINATVQDTQERLRLTSAYLTQRNIEDAARQQIRQENIITAQNDIKARIRAAGKDVAALNAIVAEAEPEFKQFALAHAEQAVGGQRRGISDPQAWADAHSAVLRGEPFEIVMGRHVGQLSDPDAERLKTLAEDKAAKEAEAKDDLYFNSLFERSRYAALDPGDKRAARAQLKQEYFERTRGLRTLRERQDVAFQLLHDREVPGPLWWRSTVTSLQAREDEINGKAVRYAVPDDVKERVKKDMEESGISAPTSEEIHNEFINNHKYYEY